MIRKPQGLVISSLDERGLYALSRDGRVLFAGTLEACRKRAELLNVPSDRDRQDHQLYRALR